MMSQLGPDVPPTQLLPVRIHTLAGLLLALALLGATAAPAADKPKAEASFGVGKGAGAFLTKEQLRVCLAQQSRIAKQNSEMLAEQAVLTRTESDVARSGETLKEQLGSLDRANEEAVAAYNVQAQARDQQIDSYQARVTAFNARVQTLTSERDSFAKNCDRRRYFEEDGVGIRKGK